MGYPIITQLALNEFTDDLIRVKSEPSDGKAAKEVSMGADENLYIKRSRVWFPITQDIFHVCTLYVKCEPPFILGHTTFLL
jgi:uncharacterized protein YehS (DUF1456 family)